MISAVGTQGEFRFMLHEGSVGAKVFVEFLKRLMLNAEKPVFLIVDGHPIHKAKMVKSYIESLDGKLKLFYLPPYFAAAEPGRNSLGSCEAEGFEPVGRERRGDEATRTRALRSIQKLPELVKSFFRQPECRYILRLTQQVGLDEVGCDEVLARPLVVASRSGRGGGTRRA